MLVPTVHSIGYLVSTGVETATKVPRSMELSCCPNSLLWSNFVSTSNAEGEDPIVAGKMEDTPLASLSLTHVHYVGTLTLGVQYTWADSPQNPGDPISYFCAWLALVPQGLCIIYVTLIWSSREVEIALMFAGQMACEALNFFLKRMIKEERPKRTTNSLRTLQR